MIPCYGSRFSITAQRCSYRPTVDQFSERISPYKSTATTHSFYANISIIDTINRAGSSDQSMCRPGSVRWVPLWYWCHFAIFLFSDDYGLRSDRKWVFSVGSSTIVLLMNCTEIWPHLTNPWQTVTLPGCEKGVRYSPLQIQTVVRGFLFDLDSFHIGIIKINLSEALPWNLAAPNFYYKFRTLILLACLSRKKTPKHTFRRNLAWFQLNVIWIFFTNFWYCHLLGTQIHLRVQIYPSRRGTSPT